MLWLVFLLVVLFFVVFDWLLIRANNYPENYDDLDTYMFKEDRKEEDDLK